MRKRKTLEDDFERLAERIWQRGRGKIKNKADFIAVYNSYLRESGAKDNIELREKTFNTITKRHKISPAITTTKERAKVFVKAGNKPSKQEFDTLGTIKGRRVYARETRTKRNGKEFRAFRDERGRFVKVKR